MANYYGQARTNYFEVKDAEAFKAELALYPVTLITQEVEGKTLYGFLDDDPDGGGLSYFYWDENDDGEASIEWEDFFVKHLADGAVAIVMEVGHEKYRYLSGSAWAINNKREIRSMNLLDIVALATELGDNVSSPSY